MDAAAFNSPAGTVVGSDFVTWLVYHRGLQVFVWRNIEFARNTRVSWGFFIVNDLLHYPKRAFLLINKASLS